MKVLKQRGLQRRQSRYEDATLTVRREGFPFACFERKNADLVGSALSFGVRRVANGIGGSSNFLRP